MNSSHFSNVEVGGPTSVDPRRFHEIARKRFRFWNDKNSFPLFWKRIENSEDKLKTLFSFFGNMQDLMATTQVDSVGVRDLLVERLKSRWTLPEKVRSQLDTNIENLKSDIKVLSNEMAWGLAELVEYDLVDPAFELFASGALTLHRPQYMTKDIFIPATNLADSPVLSVRSLHKDGVFEPDGTGFFLWAEFAFLACYLRFNVKLWLQVLPVFLRCEKIFALCYGKPRLGFITQERKFSDYQPIVEFNAVHPCQVRSFRLIGTRKIDVLESEATKCAKFAFPKDFESS